MGRGGIDGAVGALAKNNNKTQQEELKIYLKFFKFYVHYVLHRTQDNE
jgi:hypothetical protein